MDAGFLRHLRACNNTELPGGRLVFRLAGAPVGFVEPAAAGPLAALGARRDGNEVVLDDPAALPALARRLADAGAFRWRGEAFDVRARPDGPALARADRGALPFLGIKAVGAHLNGLVRRADGLHLWVARRAADKALDPGKLDHVAAGGVPAGLTPARTLAKEAEEEASIPPALSRGAHEGTVIAYAMRRPEGLRRDRIHCFDLDLPEDFVPVAADGEVAGFELWPIGRVAEAVRDTDDFKFNVNLVLIDLFLRERLIDPDGAEGRRLRAGLAGAPG